MFEGQSPKMQWRPNPDGRRTIEEAVAIAKKYGVVIPEDVAFIVDDYAKLDHTKTARGPDIKQRPSHHLVTWREFYNIDNKVPFFIRPDILDSDEAIVAVIAHELFELEKIRRLLEKRGRTVEYLIAETCPNNPGNYHDRAWDFADKLVAKMRELRHDC